MTQEMIKDMNNYFQFDNYFCTNQDILGFNYLYSQISVKYWLIRYDEAISFEQGNKVLALTCVKLCYECWKNRWKVPREPEFQKIVMKNEVEAILNESNRGDIRNLFRYAETHLINSELYTDDNLILFQL